MPAAGGSPSLGRQQHIVAEALGQCVDSEHVDSRRHQFDGQRDAVEAAADSGDGVRIRVGEPEAVRSADGAFDEELHGRKGQGRCRIELGRYGRTWQRREIEYIFACG